jgi:hypothetical protein
MEKKNLSSFCGTPFSSEILIVKNILLCGKIPSPEYGHGKSSSNILPYRHWF